MYVCMAENWLFHAGLSIYQPEQDHTICSDPASSLTTCTHEGSAQICGASTAKSEL